MIPIENIKTQNFDSIPIDSFWNTGDEKELRMHKIHAYPARFPAFITTKALEFAKEKGLTPTDYGGHILWLRYGCVRSKEKRY